MMNLEQSSSIVDFVAAADSRNVSEETYGAWHLLIGHLDFAEARQAAQMALQDETIRWTEPKHIIAKVQRIRDKRDQDQRRARALEGSPIETGVPCPLCRAHSRKIIHCDDCSRKAHQLSQELGVNSPEYQRRFYEEVAYPAAVGTF